MEYSKCIEITDTGMVIATVYGEYGHRKGLKFFTPFIRSNKRVELACKKAHKWADERIKICERNER